MIRKFFHALGVGVGAFVHDLFREQIDKRNAEAIERAHAERWARCTTPRLNVRAHCSRCGNKIGPTDRAWTDGQDAGFFVTILCSGCRGRVGREHAS